MVNHELTRLFKKPFDNKKFQNTLVNQLQNFSFDSNLKNWDFTKKGVTGVLDLYHGECLLRAKFKLDGLKDVFDDSENEFKILLTEGVLSEEMLIAWLKQIPEIENIKTQIKVSNKVFMGFADLLFEFNGKKYLADIKSCSQKNFDAILTSQEAKKEHIAQLSIYGTMFDEGAIDKVVVFYYNANNLWTPSPDDIKKVVAIDVPFDRKQTTAILNLNYKTIVKEKNYTKIQKSKNCKFCSYSTKCLNYIQNNKG